MPPGRANARPMTGSASNHVRSCAPENLETSGFGFRLQFGLLSNPGFRAFHQPPDVSFVPDDDVDSATKAIRYERNCSRIEEIHDYCRTTHCNHRRERHVSGKPDDREEDGECAERSRRV